MGSVKVMFGSMQECEKYVMAVENYPFNIDLQCGRQIIDGKSMLGILGFGLRKVLELNMHTEDEEAKREIIEKIDFCICADDIKIAI